MPCPAIIPGPVVEPPPIMPAPGEPEPEPAQEVRGRTATTAVVATNRHRLLCLVTPPVQPARALPGRAQRPRWGSQRRTPHLTRMTVPGRWDRGDRGTLPGRHPGGMPWLATCS